MAKTSEKRIYDCWWHLKQQDHTREFRSFKLFRAWALSNGYEDEAILRRLDKNKPYSPANCFWASPEKMDADYRAKMAASWDVLIDKIRIANGLPPIISTSPCAACEDQSRCEDAVCIHRARYWEKSMDDLRKGGC